MIYNANESAGYRQLKEMALAFVNAMAFIAHREDHHPDLGVHYDRCVVRYSSHDVGGLYHLGAGGVDAGLILASGCDKAPRVARGVRGSRPRVFQDRDGWSGARVRSLGLGVLGVW